MAVNGLIADVRGSIHHSFVNIANRDIDKYMKHIRISIYNNTAKYDPNIANL